MEIIGTHRIFIETSGQQRFEDGQIIGERQIQPLVESILAGRAGIVFAIPKDTPFYRPGVPNKTITADFFVGALESLLVEIRNRHFPETKSQANRDKIRVVGGQKAESPDFKTIFANMFRTPWETFHDMECFVLKYVKIGILGPDQTLSIAEWDEERMLSGINDEDIEAQLSIWGDKFFKALDAMFMANLTLSTKIMVAAAPSSDARPS